MSQTNEAETTVLSREDGTQYTLAPFSLKSTKEVADRFRGDHVINVPLPVAIKGDMDATIANLRPFIHPEADVAEVLVGKFIGQGIRLDIQKAVKDFLAARETTDTETIEVNGEAVSVREAPVEAMLAAAQTLAMTFQLGTPRTRTVGAAAKGKVAQAEAKVAKVTNTALSMYAALPAEMRAMYREQLIATGSVTAEELDGIDNAPEGAPEPEGRTNKAGRR